MCVEAGSDPLSDAEIRSHGATWLAQTGARSIWPSVQQHGVATYVGDAESTFVSLSTLS